jgi:hypothetical protein
MEVAVKKLAHDESKAKNMNLCETYFLMNAKHENIAGFIAAYLGELNRYYDIEGIELNDIKYKSLYIDIKLISQHKLKSKSYIVI